MNIWYGTKLLSALFCNSFHWWKTGLVGLWCLTPLSTIFQLYRGGKMEDWKYFKFSFLFHIDNRIWVFDCVLIHIDYIFWILHVKICITCRINPRTLYHPKGHYRVLGLIRHAIQILTCNIQYAFVQLPYSTCPCA